MINGQLVKELRTKKKFTLEHLAETIGVSRQTLYRLESSKTYSPRASLVKKLESQLGSLTLAYAMGDGTPLDLEALHQKIARLELENEVLKNEKATFIKIIENLSLAKDKDALNGSLSLWPAQSGLGAAVGASLQACA